MTRNDRQEVGLVLDQLAEAWNAGDAGAYATWFTEDADYVTFLGITMPGRAAIEAGHRALFDGPGRGSRLAFDPNESRHVRFVRPDVAIVVTRGYSTTGAAPTTGQDRASMLTFLLVHEDGWRIASFQNTRCTPLPQPARSRSGTAGPTR